MANNVFFAWQLDTPSSENKRFIWDALVKATQSLQQDIHPELAPRPDSDTQGVPGTPNIVETIFSKIRACSIFVADLSFVASTPDGKKVPNPNVLIELGFASRSIGWDRTILVLNETYGSASSLPFDILQHRWPIQYKVTEKTVVRERRFDDLTGALISALQDCESHSLKRASEMASALDTGCLGFISQNEAAPFIEMPLPALNMGQLLASLENNMVVRRLMELGALTVVAEPYIGYAWTYDGLRMIEEVKKAHPNVLQVVREHIRQVQ